MADGRLAGFGFFDPIRNVRPGSETVVNCPGIFVEFSPKRARHAFPEGSSMEGLRMLMGSATGVPK